MREIKRVAVLGSGVMGAAIAAHLANCGIPSLMLDIVPFDLSEDEQKNRQKRNSLVVKSRAALLKAKPSPLYSKADIDLIDVGNFDDDMRRIADCDWIIEVVMERLDIKKKIFDRVAEYRRKDAIVSSNTSGIPIQAMAKGMPPEMRPYFMGTHFFNPPRYLKLLELIPGADTLPEVVERIASFGEDVLGKGVVYAKDTPNFVANRLITFAMQYTLHTLDKGELTVEEIDALTGPAIGHASSATFRTADLVGLDTLQKVVANVRHGCPEDERISLMSGPAFFDQMVEKGLLGNKSGSGFYKKTSERDAKGKRVILGLDPKTLEYRAPVKPRFECTGAVRSVESLEEKLKVMHNGTDKGAKWLFSFFANLAQYTANRIPEIADDIVNIDNAVKWGFAWEIGIFETWDVLGFGAVCDRMEDEGLSLPPIARAIKEMGGPGFYKEEKGQKLFFDLASKDYKPVPVNPKALSLAHVKKADANRVLFENSEASLLDIGDGVLCVEFHSKMNSIGLEMVETLHAGVEKLEEGSYEGMIIANQAPHFCAGANLFLVLGYAMQGDWDGVKALVDGLQGVFMRMKYSPRPIVAAPHHYTFGGGMELCMHSSQCVLAGETYGGLVEVGVGVIPAGGGLKELLARALEYVPDSVPNADAFPYVRRAFENIAMAKVGTSGRECLDMGLLRNSCIVEVNWEHQVQRAKDVCLGMVKAGYTPPRPPKLWALGSTAYAAFRTGVYGMKEAGFASEHDLLIGERLAWVFTGGDRIAGTQMTEQEMLDLECEAFMALCKTEKTQQRIQQMLTTGKPLRN